MARRVKRRGFTLIELMVVIAIIALLATMSFKGIQKARETARRMKCSQQMRDISIALNLYETEKRSYPGYRNVLLMTNNASYSNPQNPGQGGVSWVIPMLPYLDQANVYDAFRTPVTGNASGGGGSGGAGGGGGSGGQSGPIISSNYAQIRIESLYCPSDEPSMIGGTPLAYVVNTGCIDVQGTPRSQNSQGMPRDWAANGVFFDRFTGNPTASYSGSGGSSSSATNQIPMVSQSNSWVSQRDGISQTLMVSENVDHGQYMDVLEQGLGFIWDISGQVSGNQNFTPGSPPPQMNPTNPNYRINMNRGQGAAAMTGALLTQSQQYNFTRPSSQHTGGVNVTFCDSHVDFLNEQIEYFVYCLLMSPDGKNVKQPGQTNPLQNNWFKVPLDESWILR